MSLKLHEVSIKTVEDAASALIGMPYAIGGRDRNIGLDCWGMIVEFYGMLGIRIPAVRYTYKDAKWWESEDEEIFENYKPDIFEPIVEPHIGCILTFKVGKTKIANHCGINLLKRKMLNTDYKVGIHTIPIARFAKFWHKMYMPAGLVVK